MTVPVTAIPTASIQPLQTADPKGGLPHTICTVFSINEQDHLWATAAHCVTEDDDEGKIAMSQTLLGGFPTQVVYFDAKLDIAVIHAAISAPAIPRGTPPSRGDSVRVYGYMWGVYDAFSFSGTIATLNARHYMIFDMRVGGGHSGSPILNDAGAVVSIMQVSEMGFSGGAVYGYLDDLMPFWR
jgi:S1-C subfamily serine protease